MAKLALFAGVALVLGVGVMQLVGWRTAAEEARRWFGLALDTVAGAGPWWFFTAMAILPVVGAPISPFAVTAGAVFAGRLGLVPLSLLVVAAISINLTLTYWMARRWLRPFLARVLERFGYVLPRLEKGDAVDLIVFLRVTPGVPFFVQNYLLGLADAPFARYLGISCGIQSVLNVAFMLFGEALMQGKGKLALSAILLLAAALSGTHLLRKRLAKKKGGGA